MRAGPLLILFLLLAAGCVTPDPAPAEPTPTQRRLNDIQAPGATSLDEGGNRTFTWKGTLGRGADVPLVGGAVSGQYDRKIHNLPVDESVGTVTVSHRSAQSSVAYLRTDDNRLACVARAGRVCSIHPNETARAEWTLSVVSLAPQGGDYTVTVTLDPRLPTYGTDPSESGRFVVHDAKRNGGEPTLAVLKDGRVLVVAGTSVLRLGPEGGFTDVTPPLDAATRQTLDPFLVGDPVTGRVYVSQLAQCMRVSWTDDAGATWTTNPATCGGPEQHHQKMALGPGLGPGPASRTVHLAMMNLASWLATDEVVIVYARSLDGGYTWTQNPAEVKQAHGMEARAVGNIAATDDAAVHVIAYLCDKFVDAAYNGVGVGRSTDQGLTWSWKKIGNGGGRCEGIDPGIATAGNQVHALWEDLSAGPGAIWYASSGANHWTPQSLVPTPGLGSFVFTDAAASKDRVVAAFLATPDTTIGPTQAPGWARWFPYLVSRDLRDPAANWTITRLQDDPVQIGPICMDGPMCLDGARNLLDFIDVQLGPDGRAYVAYPDGCNEQCQYPWQSRGSVLRVAVETQGTGPGH